MAYTDEALKAKLAILNETQDSIVSVSQWIQFHKRHADKIANYWLTRLRDSPPPRRLNFIYLVNDIVQNARARRRPEFPDAFSPLMPEAVQTAYRSSTPEIQQKIRRVIEVWKTRNVFEAPIIEAINARIDEVDKSKGTSGKKILMGKSLFTSSGSEIPKELESLAPLQVAVTKATITARTPIDNAQTEYMKLNDSEITQPSPPVFAARLSSLIRSLAAAESSLSETIKARNALISDLQKTLEVNKSALAKDEQTYMEITSRKTSTEAKKREVEDSIMKGLASTEDSTEVAGTDSQNARSGSASFRHDAPEVEELTPEPEEERLPAIVDESIDTEDTSGTSGKIRSASSQSFNGTSAKRRKLSHGQDGDVPDLGDMGMGDLVGQQTELGESGFQDLDADVSELIRQESAKI